MEPGPLKRTLSASMLKQLERESEFVSYEWEELVERLSCSDDPKLRSIGYQESEVLRTREKVAKVSMNRT